MSIERLERDGGVVWRVRWREGARNRSKVLGRKRDAEAFDAEVRRLKRTHELGRLDAGKETLAEFGEQWWRLHAEPNLGRTPLELYAMLCDTHILPRLGEVRLRDLSREELQRFASSSRPPARAPPRCERRSPCSTASSSARSSGGGLRRPRSPASQSRRRDGGARSSRSRRKSWSASATTCSRAGARATPPWSPCSPPRSACSPTPDCARARRSRFGGATSASAQS